MFLLWNRGETVGPPKHFLLSSTVGEVEGTRVAGCKEGACLETGVGLRSNCRLSART